MTARRVLLLVDVQCASFGTEAPAYDSARLLSTISGLVARARASHTPVVYVQHCGGEGDPDKPGSPGFPIHPEVAPLTDELIFQKHTPDSFRDTGLHDHLQAICAESLIICGIQTEYCIDTTVRRAHSLGYQVLLVGDGHSTWDGSLSAAQKIAYHNQVLGGYFAQVAQADGIALV